MNFIETLKSVGGVKPCPDCKGCGKIDSDFGNIVPCLNCHGTGQALNFAPLLAKPGALSVYVEVMLKSLGYNWHARWFKIEQPKVIVGPQRAHSMVYEVSRQLGGTAVVAERCLPDEAVKFAHQVEMDLSAIESEILSHDGTKRIFSEWSCPAHTKKWAKDLQSIGYRLSLPIPPDATVLFVTDRVDEKEMDQVIHATWNPDMGTPFPTILPYILALISSTETYRLPWINEKGFKVISLHQEKP